MAMRRRRLEWFGHVKRRDETENIRAVAEMKMEGKRPRRRPQLRWKDTVRRDVKAWSIREVWATDRERQMEKSLQDPLPCNQRQFFSHDVELNNKDILHFTFTHGDGGER